MISYNSGSREMCLKIKEELKVFYYYLCYNLGILNKLKIYKVKRQPKCLDRCGTDLRQFIDFYG